MHASTNSKDVKNQTALKITTGSQFGSVWLHRPYILNTERSGQCFYGIEGWLVKHWTENESELSKYGNGENYLVFQGEKIAQVDVGRAGRG